MDVPLLSILPVTMHVRCWMPVGSPIPIQSWLVDFYMLVSSYHFPESKSCLLQLTWNHGVARKIRVLNNV